MRIATDLGHGLKAGALQTCSGPSKTSGADVGQSTADITGPGQVSSSAPVVMIVRVCGGIGNQMFQYAAAKGLATRIGARLLVDTTLLDGATTRSYRLGAFTLCSSEAHPVGIRRAVFRLACSPRDGLRPLTGRLRSVLGLTLVRESTRFRVDHGAEERLMVHGPARAPTFCLDGYWQCPAYFAGAEDTIRREFTLRSQPSSPNPAMLRRIQAVNAVSLHVRRGDYLTLKDTPVLPLHYYTSASKLITGRVPDPHWFVFSDDIAWAQDNLRLSQPTVFVDVNGPEADYEDLRLMSACKHHVIANSSFSWWGAWLNGRSDKVVVAPKYWMCRHDTYYPELFPSGWTCLGVL